MTNESARKLPAAQRVLLLAFDRHSILRVDEARGGRSAFVRTAAGFTTVSVEALDALVRARALKVSTAPKGSTYYMYTRTGALMRAAVVRTSRVGS